MKVFAIVVATVMAIVTMIYHIMQGSSLFFLFIQVTLTWFGFALSVLLIEYAYAHAIFGRTGDYDDSVASIPRPTEVTNRPGDDDYFR